MLSPRGQQGLKAKFFGLGLVVSRLGLVLGLVQRWPRYHLGWPRGLVNHHNLVVNLTLSFDTIMTSIAIFLELNSN